MNDKFCLWLLVVKVNKKARSVDRAFFLIKLLYPKMNLRVLSYNPFKKRARRSQRIKKINKN